MIRVRVTEGFAEPVLLCDICSSLILDGRQAAALYPRSTDEGDVLQVLHVHKEKCLARGEAKLGAVPVWLELEDHLRYLIRNCGVSAAKLAGIDAHERPD